MSEQGKHLVNKDKNTASATGSVNDKALSEEQLYGRESVSNATKTDVSQPQESSSPHNQINRKQSSSSANSIRSNSYRKSMEDINSNAEKASENKKDAVFANSAFKKDNDTDSIKSVTFENSDFKSEEKDGDDEPDFFDRISQYSLYMQKDARYYFQHPYARIFIAYFVTFCNFLIYAEDPVAHSVKESTIPAIGNAFAFVCTRYPPNYWSFIKVLLWLIGIACGLLFGKLVIHKLLLTRLIKLEMFQHDQGSWMVMFLTTILSLFIFSWIFNGFLSLDPTNYALYGISGLMGINNAWFMKAAACGTWCGDFFTAWMVTDIMLQENLYPGWAVRVRAWWKRGYNRIILFWCVLIIATVLVVVVITTDIINWDTLNRGFLPTNELSRGFLASFILVMDLLIVMQDWDYPHFINSLDIKLPGLNTAHIKIEIPKCLRKLENWTVHITGKWFNYGIIFLVMLLDLNMWKNQIFYAPYDYGQYTDTDGRVYTVLDQNQLQDFNSSYLNYDWRSNNTNPDTNRTYIEDDTSMHSRFYDYHLGIKALAFIPSVSTLIVFIVLIFIYGRVKPSKKDPYSGRLIKRPKNQKIGIVTLVRMKLFRQRVKRNDVNVLDGGKSVESNSQITEETPNYQTGPTKKNATEDSIQNENELNETDRANINNDDLGSKPMKNLSDNPGINTSENIAVAKQDGESADNGTKENTT